MNSQTEASPRPPLILMLLTYVVGGVGFFVIVTPGARQRGLRGIIGIAVWGAMMIAMGKWGMSAA